MLPGTDMFSSLLLVVLTLIKWLLIIVDMSFYKLVLLSTLDGIPVVYDLVPANLDERDAAEVVLQRVRNCDVFGDKGFIGDDWQATIQAHTGNCIWTAKRANQANQKPPEFDRLLSHVRERVEGVFHRIQNTGRTIERLLTQTVNGLCTRVILKVTALVLKMVLHREFGIDVNPLQPFRIHNRR